MSGVMGMSGGKLMVFYVSTVAASGVVGKGTRQENKCLKWTVHKKIKFSQYIPQSLGIINI